MIGWGKILEIFPSGNAVYKHYNSETYVKWAEKAYQRRKSSFKELGANLIDCVKMIPTGFQSDRFEDLPLRILDIGGRWGDHYFPLQQLKRKITYHIVDTPANVIAGKNRHKKNPNMSFMHIREIDREYDIIYSSSCYPIYFADWKELAKTLADTGARYILIDKCPMTQGKTIILEQITKEGIIPYRIIGAQDLYAEFQSLGYEMEILDQFQDKTLENAQELPTNEEIKYYYARFKKK